MPFVSLNDIAEVEPISGFKAKFIHSDSMTVAYWNIKAGHRVPEHNHHHEMIINCMSGTFEVTVDGETHELHAGDVVVVPSFAKHSAAALTDCTVIDVFSPVRDDYKTFK